MKIANRLIGTQHAPLVIAEIGINHNGSLDAAKSMVKAASQAGAEMVKHQTHFVSDEMTEEAKTVIPANDTRSIWEIMEACALSPDEEIQLKKYAEGLGLIYISTPFSRSAADFLNTIDVPAFKIGSGECDNLPLIRHIANFGKPIIMSTGMQSIETLQESVAILEEADCDYALLECTNLYPSPPEIVSLQGVTELSSAFPNAVVGFSDHSIGSEMCIAATALGACILERHFVDSRYRQGPDVSCSMDPIELKYLIERSREIHIALHNSKSRSKAEEATYRFARSSVVADKSLKAGQILSEDDIWARRPGTGDIPGYDLSKLIGKRLKKDKEFNEQLNWEDIG
ncbi:N,N'-diacetyllegionaminic acid synthase [Pseudovibrio axinellae]|uniref:N,N'-diacetyllegionaminic acid synthase n=1 Tax=Pseudovibrio axinellae TaxID=989403 RepID=A0A165TXF5_9HYPH|nr:N-acetylneuraminate synthase family protein [Pseudovibrio axinellae]KZL07211.1 N,N'-diacetyllegionaminic acid synthase [Pseudovibrio axinellae]SER83993.1 N-acetylneuraminate synthase [Pseudovibrio axinellae]